MSNETHHAHRNVRKRKFHIPAVGVRSKEVEDFARDQLKHHKGDLDLEKEFPVENNGWHGFVEWEKYPERCKKAALILATKTFTQIPEFQLIPLPATNPILIGNRWKEYHLALGASLSHMPAESWDIVQEEMAKDQLCVLDFPYNGEPPREALMKDHITDNSHFFVRNHGGVPTVPDKDYFLDVSGLIGRPGRLTLAELQDEKLFPQVEMTISLQCSGTRRIEQIALYPGEGDELLSAPWAEGAIGTAVWKGVQLKKILKHFGGVTSPENHVEFIGADTYFKKNEVFNYAVSVPYRKAQINEVLIAYQMNGVPLPKMHGGPVRAVVCGFIGARSCKWLTRINILSEPCLGPVQRQEYLYFNSQIGKHNSKYSKGFSIGAMPVSSAMLYPADNSIQVHNGFIECSGWAYSGGGNWVERVEVSSDGGFVWYEVPEANLSPKYYHAKRLWKISLPVQAEGWLELVVRCWDSACNTQPTQLRDAWNWTLHVTSSAHRIKVYSANKSNPDTADRLAKLEAHGDGLDPITRPIETFTTETKEEYALAMAVRGSREPKISA